MENNIRAMMDLLSKDINGDPLTNSAAIGYMILAAQEAGLDKETVLEIEANMRYFMDFTTHKAAAETYKSFI